MVSVPERVGCILVESSVRVRIIKEAFCKVKNIFHKLNQVPLKQIWFNKLFIHVLLRDALSRFISSYAKETGLKHQSLRCLKETELCRV